MKKQDAQQTHDNDRYAVPTNVSARFELFKGFGLKEMGLCVGAALVGILIFAIVSIPKKEVPVEASPTLQASLTVEPTGGASGNNADFDGDRMAGTKATPLLSSSGDLEAEEVMSQDYEGGYDDLSSGEGSALATIAGDVTIGGMTIPRGSIVIYLVAAPDAATVLPSEAVPENPGEAVKTSTDLPATASAAPTTSPSATVAATLTPKPTATPVKAQGISLSYDAVDLQVGAQMQLKAYVQPGNADNLSVRWQSGDPAVATVDVAGNVTAKNIGSTFILAVSEDGGFAVPCIVNVLGATPTSSPTVAPTPSPAPTPTPAYMNPLQIYPGTSTIDAGNAVDLTVSGNEGVPVTFTTNQASIAVVDGFGHVTALSPGTATITAKTADGQKSAYAVIIVRQPVVSLSLSTSKVDMAPGDTVALTAFVQPSNASDQAVTWTSGNPSIASVDAAGRVTARAEGKTVITATANGAALSVTASATVEVAPVGGLLGFAATPPAAARHSVGLLDILVPVAHAAETSGEADAPVQEVQKTKTVNAVPDAIRFLCIVIPVATMAFLCLPVGQSQSLLDTIKAATAYRRRQHLFYNRRED